MLSLPYRAEFDTFTTFSGSAGFFGFAELTDEDDGSAASTQVPFHGAVAPSSSAIGTRGNPEG
jgi:hypothetical protein